MQRLQSLSEAREYSDAFVMLSGDYGGQIYVIAPVNLVCCAEGALQQLLVDIDWIAWDDVGGDTNISYMRLAADHKIASLTKDKASINGIWLHSEFMEIPGLADEIRAVLSGSQHAMRRDLVYFANKWIYDATMSGVEEC